MRRGPTGGTKGYMFSIVSNCYKLLQNRYLSFGYVVEGADVLSDTKEGDVIVSAKVTEGLEFLKQPK